MYLFFLLTAHSICVGETRQFCKLQDDGTALSATQSNRQSLMRAAISQLNLSACAYHHIVKLTRKTADLAGNEEIQSVHLAEALHASQSSEVDVGTTMFLIQNLPLKVYACLFCNS